MFAWILDPVTVGIRATSPIFCQKVGFRIFYRFAEKFVTEHVWGFWGRSLGKLGVFVAVQKSLSGRESGGDQNLNDFEVGAEHFMGLTVWPSKWQSWTDKAWGFLDIRFVLFVGRIRQLSLGRVTKGTDGSLKSLNNLTSWRRWKWENTKSKGIEDPFECFGTFVKVGHGRFGTPRQKMWRDWRTTETCWRIHIWYFGRVLWLIRASLKHDYFGDRHGGSVKWL